MDITAVATPDPQPNPQTNPQNRQLVMSYIPAKIEITEAPDVIEVSLLFMQQMDKALHQWLDVDMIGFGGQVAYQVIGWDNVKKCLILGKVV